MSRKALTSKAAGTLYLRRASKIYS